MKRFLANYPPRCSKTIVTSVCWPIWTWLQKGRSTTSGPGVRFLCASYNDDLSRDYADKMRSLINSPWFQARWGDRIKIRNDKDRKSDFANEQGGGRISTSMKGGIIGRGGDIIMIDDPHNTQTAESDADRLSTLRGWKELSTTRLNNPQKSAIVVIMQRLHEEDVSGAILASSAYARGEWCHLMIPMRYDERRHCITSIGWSGSSARATTRR